MNGEYQQTRGAARPRIEPVYREAIQRIPVPGTRLESNVYVEARDGVKLAVDIYRPKKEGRYPALLSMAPYLKETQQNHAGLSHSVEAGASGFYVRRGYVHVICQARGSGCSQGQWGFLDSKEQEDGYDVVEWIAAQPWCNGNVGLIGDSYWAWIQYVIAAQQPPHLKCIVPHDGGADLYRDAFYPGGVFNSGEFAYHWVTDTMFQCFWPGGVEGKLSPINLSYELAANPEDGPFYWERSAYTRVDRIKVPVLNCASLTRVHTTTQLAMHPLIKAPKKLIIEPEAGFWAHLHFLTSRPLNEYILRWLDYWLKGVDTGIMDEPEVAIYDAGAGRWYYEDSYPPEAHWTRHYFHSSGLSGSLSADIPTGTACSEYRTPDSTKNLLEGNPVLSYTSPPMEEPLRVWGPLSVTLYGSSNQPDTAWFVKLMDIGPDNQPRQLSRGILRASFREIDPSRSKPGQPFHPFRNPSPLTPGEIYEFQIEMRPIFYTFQKGHRLQVQIASDDPHYFGVLHTLDMNRLPEPSENRVFSGPDYPSHILLPVMEKSPGTGVTEPLSRVQWPVVKGTRWTDLNERPPLSWSE